MVLLSTLLNVIEDVVVPAFDPTNHTPQPYQKSTIVAIERDFDGSAKVFVPDHYAFVDPDILFDQQQKRLVLVSSIINRKCLFHTHSS